MGKPRQRLEPGYRVPEGEKTCIQCGETMPVSGFYWYRATERKAYQPRARCKRCLHLWQYAHDSKRNKSLSAEEWLELHEPEDAFRDLDRLEGIPNFSSPTTALPRGRTEYRKWLEELLEQVYYPALEGDGQAA